MANLIIIPERQDEPAVAVAPSTRPVRPKREPRTPIRPTVEQLKEIVMRHCGYMMVANVDGLCGPQTEALIDELAKHFG